SRASPLPPSGERSNAVMMIVIDENHRLRMQLLQASVMVARAEAAHDAANAAHVEHRVLDLELHPAFGHRAGERDLAVRDEDDDVRAGARALDELVDFVLDVGVARVQTRELER